MFERCVRVGDDMKEKRPIMAGILGGHAHGKTTLLETLRRRLEHEEAWRASLGEAPGVTSVHVWEGERCVVTLLDLPGGARRMRHMLTRLALLDVGVLVVSAREGFDTSMFEQLWCARCMGVERWVVFVNTMDLSTSDPRCARAWEDTSFWLSELGVDAQLVMGAASEVGAPSERLLSEIDALGASIERTSEGPPVFYIERTGRIGPRAYGAVLGKLARGRLEFQSTLHPLLSLYGWEHEGHYQGPARAFALGDRGEDQTLMPGAYALILSTAFVRWRMHRGQVLGVFGTLSSHAQVTCRVEVYPGRRLDALVRSGRAQVQAYMHCASVTARVSRGEGEHLRLTLRHPVWVEAGQRIVLRDARGLVGGGEVVSLEGEDQATPLEPHRAAVEAGWSHPGVDPSWWGLER